MGKQTFQSIASFFFVCKSISTLAGFKKCNRAVRICYVKSLDCNTACLWRIYTNRLLCLHQWHNSTEETTKTNSWFLTRPFVKRLENRDTYVWSCEQNRVREMIQKCTMHYMYMYRKILTRLLFVLNHSIEFQQFSLICSKKKSLTQTLVGIEPGTRAREPAVLSVPQVINCFMAWHASLS